MCSSSLGGLTTALASRRLRGEGSMPARDRRAFTMEAWLLVFMEKMGCPAARAATIRASSPPFSLSRVVKTASASCTRMAHFMPALS